MKESEDKQDCCALDMPNGLHSIDYPQKFMHAPKSAYPQKNPKSGMKCEPVKIMSQTLHAK